MGMRRALVALAILVLPAAMLAPVWRLGGLGASEDDLLYYFPSRSFFHETIAGGEWPWINAWSGLDRPFAADPQSALWYPSTWLFALTEPLPAYAASLWLHYSLAIWGMYRLLRSGRLGRGAALFGGLLFAFSGFMLAHRAHFSLQHAAAWTPWVFWLVKRFADKGGGGRLVMASLAAMLQLYAGHVQIAAITALGSLVYVVAARGAGFAEAARQVRRLGLVAARWFGVWLIASGLFAVQLVPTVLWLRQCTRVERTYRDFVENSWYPWSALGWVAPMLFGQRTPNFFDQAYWGPSHQCEQFAYVGIVPLVLAALTARIGWRNDRRRRPWVVLLALGLLLALGQFGPLCPILYWIPGSSLFRVPARALLLFDLAVAALAAIALHDLSAAPDPRRVRLRAALQRWTARPHVKGIALAVIPVVAVAAAVPFLPVDWRAAALHALRPWSAAVVVPVVVAVASFASLGVAARCWRRRIWLWLPVLACAIDLGVLGWTIDIPPWQRCAADLLPRDEHGWEERVRESSQRLWVVAETADIYGNALEALPANVNSLVGIPSLTDYGPLQPRTLQERFAFKPWGMSQNAEALLNDTSWMRAFNVGWVLVRDPRFEPAGCDLEYVDAAGWRLYRSASAAGMAIMEDPTLPAVVSSAARSNHEFELIVDLWAAGKKRKTSGTGAEPDARVIVSRLAQPGWTAQVAGHTVAIESAEGLMSVRVPAGDIARIEFSYFPPGLWQGILVSGLTVAVLFVLALPRPRGERLTAEEEQVTVVSQTVSGGGGPAQ